MLVASAMKVAIHLHAMRQGRFRAAAIDVIGAEHVSDEDAIEQTALQQTRQFDPVIHAMVGLGAVLRV